MRLQKLNPFRAVYLRFGKAGIILFVITIISFVAALGGFYWYTASSTAHDPFSKDIKQKVAFDLYYPTYMPQKEFYFDQAAYDPNDKVATYNYAAPGGKAVYVSIQSKPKDFDYAEFRTKQMSGTRQIETPIGTADIGMLQELTVSSIMTDKVWVMITVGQGVDIGGLEQISKSLVKSQ